MKSLLFGQSAIMHSGFFDIMTTKEKIVLVSCFTIILGGIAVAMGMEGHLTCLAVLVVVCFVTLLWADTYHDN